MNPAKNACSRQYIFIFELHINGYIVKLNKSCKGYVNYITLITLLYNTLIAIHNVTRDCG